MHMDNDALEELQEIEETSTELQRQGSYIEALEWMERGLVLRRQYFGAQSEEVWSACKVIGEMCNLLAMSYLQQEDFPMTLELLKKAEILTEKDNYGKAVTYNNLACYYRKKGKLHAALTYLKKAIKIESRLDHVSNRADTHLNLCAVLSQLGKHAPALEHAQTSLILLQEELFPNPLSPSRKVKPRELSADRIAVLAIAYHNVGVEYEFLKRREKAVESYRKGVDISETHLGTNHPITQSLLTSCTEAEKAISAQAAKKKTTTTKAPPKRPTKAVEKKPPPKSVTEHRRDEKKWKKMHRAYGDVVREVKPNLPQRLALQTEDDEEDGGFMLTSPLSPISNTMPSLRGADSMSMNFDDLEQSFSNMMTPRDKDLIDSSRLTGRNNDQDDYEESDYIDDEPENEDTEAQEVEEDTDPRPVSKNDQKTPTQIDNYDDDEPDYCQEEPLEEEETKPSKDENSARASTEDQEYEEEIFDDETSNGPSSARQPSARQPSARPTSARPMSARPMSARPMSARQTSARSSSSRQPSARQEYTEEKYDEQQYGEQYEAQYANDGQVYQEQKYEEQSYTQAGYQQQQQYAYDQQAYQEQKYDTGYDAQYQYQQQQYTQQYDYSAQQYAYDTTSTQQQYYGQEEKQDRSS